jgi:alpha,alpha-trehalase
VILGSNSLSNPSVSFSSNPIFRGLIEQNKTETLKLALGMIENFFFQIEYYGGILNANRTYYLSRSQPPFLSSMLLELLKDFQTKTEEVDSFFSKTLQEILIYNGYKFIERELRECWLQPHRTYTPSDSISDCILPSPSPSPSLPADGVLFESLPDSDIISTTTFSSTPTYSSVSRFIPSLSRFHGGKGTPVVEMGHDNHYYDSVAKQATTLEVEFLKEVSRQKPLEELTGEDLTEDFYIADRAMRESGFDVSFRFGPFSGATHHYLPVCLNSLLYKAERDLSILAKDETSFYWKERADFRRKLMNKLLWNEEKGLFLDFNTRKQEQSSYEYLSTFYPLWVGLASQEQAEKVVSHLHLFEQSGGLACSPTESGAQWDLPYGWAPLHLITIEGLRKYGFETEANRLSVKFLSTILSR